MGGATVWFQVVMGIVPGQRMFKLRKEENGEEAITREEEYSRLELECHLVRDSTREIRTWMVVLKNPVSTAVWSDILVCDTSSSSSQLFGFEQVT